MHNVLILDIETSPNLAYVWGAWKQNVGYKQFVDNTKIMCWAAKWWGKERVFIKNSYENKEEDVVGSLVALLDAADIVVAHNGRRFDIPTVRSRAVSLKIAPFSPIKVVDTLDEAKRLFNFPLNSPAYLAEYLGVRRKTEHTDFPGFDLWSEAIKGNPKAWESMMSYNIDDVHTLEDVYNELLPWMDRHPNVNVSLGETEIKCPRCGGEVVKRGFYSTNVNIYQRYRCKECGGWSRSRYTENTLEERQAVLASA